MINISSFRPGSPGAAAGAASDESRAIEMVRNPSATAARAAPCLPRPGNSRPSRVAPPRSAPRAGAFPTLSSSRSRSQAPVAIASRAPAAPARPNYGPVAGAVTYCCAPAVGVRRWVGTNPNKALLIAYGAFSLTILGVAVWAIVHAATCPECPYDPAAASGGGP